MFQSLENNCATFHRLEDGMLMDHSQRRKLFLYHFLLPGFHPTDSTQSPAPPGRVMQPDPGLIGYPDIDPTPGGRKASSKRSARWGKRSAPGAMKSSGCGGSRRITESPRGVPYQDGDDPEENQRLQEFQQLPVAWDCLLRKKTSPPALLVEELLLIKPRKVSLVHLRGFEPPRRCRHKNLNLACLPVSPQVRHRNA